MKATLIEGVWYALVGEEIVSPPFPDSAACWKWIDRKDGESPNVPEKRKRIVKTFYDPSINYAAAKAKQPGKGKKHGRR